MFIDLDLMPRGKGPVGQRHNRTSTVTMSQRTPTLNPTETLRGQSDDDLVSLPIDIDDFVEEFTHCCTGECRVNVFPVLQKIGFVSTQSADLAALLAIVLEVMQQSLKMQRGMLMLYDRHSDTIFIHESFGLDDEEKGRGIYAPGERITGKVVESGKAIIVARLFDNTDFHDRTGAQADRGRSNASFICVPIVRAQKVLGTICAERVYMHRHLLKQDVKLLVTIASMIALVVVLMSYHWPSNVREPENVVERAVILSDDGVIHNYDLPPSLQTAHLTGTANAFTLEAKLRTVEHEMIVEALKSSNGNIGEAATELGLTRRMLGLRMQRHTIHYKPFRNGGSSTSG